MVSELFCDILTDVCRSATFRERVWSTEQLSRDSQEKRAELPEGRAASVGGQQRGSASDMPN